MRRERELGERVASLEALKEAVSAMKSLSAHHFRETRALLDPARKYRAGIDRIVATTGARLPGGSGATGLLVLGAELGLCGAYGRSVAMSAVQRRRALGPGPTFCVGRRTGRILQRNDVPLAQVYAAPTSIGGITDALIELVQAMLGDYVNQGMAAFEVVSCRFQGVGHYQPTTTRLLPIELAPSESGAEARYVSPGALSRVVVRELLYITLYELLLDALATEHGARLSATQSAEQWLISQSSRLRRQLAAARRETSTQEVLEIASGVRARAAEHRSK